MANADRSTTSHKQTAADKRIEVLSVISSAQCLIDNALAQIGTPGTELDIEINGEDVLILRAMLNEALTRLDEVRHV